MRLGFCAGRGLTRATARARACSPGTMGEILVSHVSTLWIMGGAFPMT